MSEIKVIDNFMPIETARAATDFLQSTTGYHDGSTWCRYKPEIEESIFYRINSEAHHHSGVDGINTTCEKPQCYICWINDIYTNEEMIKRVSKITGIELTTTVTHFTSWYDTNQFLSPHTDLGSTDGRKVAVLPYFVNVWNPAWGGLLHFTKDNKEVSETVVPAFNRAAIIDLGEFGYTHWVSQVRENLPTDQKRIAMTIWFS